MITNAALVIRPFVGLAFLIARLMLSRNPASRASGWLIALGGVLFGGAEAYGVITLHPFVGGDYDERWQSQIAATAAFSTLGLVLCAAGLLAAATRWRSGSSA